MIPALTQSKATKFFSEKISSPKNTADNPAPKIGMENQ